MEKNSDPKWNTIVPQTPQSVNELQTGNTIEHSKPNDMKVIKFYQSMEKCTDSLCPYENQLHFHCCHSSGRCHFATSYALVMDKHLDEFHNCSMIPENFDYFDKNYDCRQYGCSNNKVTYAFAIKIHTLYLVQVVLAVGTLGL